ncbi:MAG TPA: lysylphosphatidylglycerol synthase transmembrane domain-containing protein [Acidimicrobiales bacterium]|nr:lysylphosphatidylglycerol synthase transmembrane domain-containing protein [Acidimicrobiales bacterium]
MLDAEREPIPGEATGRRPWVALPTLVGVLLAIVCLGFVAGTLVSQWSEVRDRIADAAPGWLVLAVLAAGAAMTWIAWCWEDALALVGHRPGRRRVIAWYYAGEIGKYLPGTVWPILGRGELARRGGVPASRAYPSVALSLATLYLAGLSVAAVLVPLDLAQQAESPAALALLVLLPVGLAALHPAVLGRARRVVVRLTGRGAGVPLPQWRATAAVVVRYVPAWLAIWAATWLVARALVPDPPILRIGIAATLSWAAGFVAVPVPAGAGVREAVFVAASGMPGGLAATVAVASRLAFVLVDVAGLVLTARWHRAAPRLSGATQRIEH